MPIPLQTRIDKLQVQMQNYGVDLQMAYQKASNLGMQLNAEGNPNSSTEAYALGSQLLKMHNHWQNSTDDIRDMLIWCLQYINDNAFNGGVGAVTMDSILEAMWDSDKLRWFHFINYIDSMRAGIWNTEIYETHLAEWYRHFSL